MSDGPRAKFMASPSYVGLYGFAGLMFFLNAILNFLMGRQLNAIVQLALALLDCFVTYRYLKIPAIEIADNYLEFIYRQISSRKKILFSNLIDLERAGNKRKIVLSDGSSFAIPYKILKKTERDSAIEIINSKIIY